MRTFLFATVSLITLAGTTPAFAAAAGEDAAYSKNDKPVYDSRGNCVRTQWQGEQDPCAPATPAPAPKPMAAPAPAPAPTPAPVPQVALEQRTVYFDFNSAALTAESTAKLDQLAAAISKASGIFEVRIHGYTDQIGSTSYNDALAAKRAKAVKDYLDGKSNRKAIEGDIRGLGKAESDAACKAIKKRAAQISCMAKQRRVEVEFKAQE